MKKLFIVAACLVTAFCTAAQDLHFTRVHEMNSWYNQGLQPDRRINAALNYRTLNYQGIIAFRTTAGLVNVPLLRSANRDKGTGGYATLTGGATLDQSNNGVLRNSNAIAGVAYSVPLNGEATTFVSAGFQGAFFQSAVDMSRATLPDQYDRITLTPVRATNDPYQSSQLHYMSLNAGVSVVHNSVKNGWYAGASVRHINTPEASNKAGGYQLPRSYGVQLGYRHQLNEDQRIALHSVLNWRANAYEHLANLQYHFEFNRFGYDRGLSAGVGYRYGDAIIPNVEVRLERTTFGFNYDMSVGGMRSTGMRRHGLEAGVRHRF